MLYRVAASTVFVALIAAAASLSTQGSALAQHEHHNPWEGVTEAVCVITPTEGNTAHGVIRFTQTDEGVRVVGDVHGLTPGSKHGFHIHQYGDATASNGTSAGGHYNPDGHDHAGPAADTRHAGDLGNLEADANGHAHYEATLTNITIAGHHNPIVGRGMIVHAGEDDLASQPTGAAGARIGIGVIGIAQP